MKKMKNLFMCVVAAAMALTSCSGDDDGGSGNSGGGDIKYEITGNYSGVDGLDVTYTTASGGATNAEALDLPWSLSFTADNNVHGAGFSTSTGDAEPGEKITMKIYRNGNEIKSLEATANSDGIIVGTISAAF